MSLSKIKLIELDKKLIKLAADNFDEFCLITAVDKVQAFICIERKKGKSIRQINISSGIPRSTIGDICKKCPNISDGTN